MRINLQIDCISRNLQYLLLTLLINSFSKHKCTIIVKFCYNSWNTVLWWCIITILIFLRAVRSKLYQWHLGLDWIVQIHNYKTQNNWVQNVVNMNPNPHSGGGVLYIYVIKFILFVFNDYSFFSRTNHGRTS